MSNPLPLNGAGAKHTTSLHARAWCVYLVVLALGIGGYLFVRWLGEGRARPLATDVVPIQETSSQAVLTQATTGQTSPSPRVHVVFHVLLTMSAMIALGNLLGRGFRYLGQPPVIGEVVAGLCLGPSLLGAIAPDAMHLFIPETAADPQGQVVSALKMIAQLGVILYMFVVGLDLNANKVKDQVHAAVIISHVSIVAPFLLGAILALWLFPQYAPAGVSFTAFSLFIGVAMAITAFPVLARILTDRGLESTRMGSVALACAAADDVTAWCLLALVVGIVQTDVTDAARVVLASLAFIGAMFWIAKPLVHRWCRRIEDMTRSTIRGGARLELPKSALVIGLLGVLLSALTTEVIGIHAIFGAFLFGAIIPRDSLLAQELSSRLRDPVTILMLPAFFAYTGMRTRIGLVSGAEQWLVCLAIIAVATLGKFGGTFVAARAARIGWKDATALGLLMNTRGLMGLIVLDIGLDLGVISPVLFAMMVVMALATTMATAPALALLTGPGEEDWSSSNTSERPSTTRDSAARESVSSPS